MPRVINNPTKAKVGIFMPYYNMGGFIDEALESLYHQNFTDFAVIIADDASPSKSAVRKLSRTNRPRCEIFFEKKNLGLVKISNKYMKKLEAEYIMLFSPDDKMHPDLLKAEVEYLDRHPEVAAVCTNIQEFGDGDSLIEYNDESCSLPYMLVVNRFSGAALIRKSAWLAAGMHDTNRELYPNLDYDLWLSMLEKGFKLGTISKPLFYWRVERNSLSHRVKPEQILVFRKALFKKYLALYEKHFYFVAKYYLHEISKFEDYYKISQEGHDWLDNQYRQLTKQTADLTKQTADLTKQIEELTSRLNESVQKPYLRSLCLMLLKKLKH